MLNLLMVGAIINTLVKIPTSFAQDESRPVLSGACSESVDNYFTCELVRGSWQYSSRHGESCAEGYGINDNICGGTARICGPSNNFCCVPCARIELFKICDQIGELEQKQQCNACLNADGLWTAVGCINREPTNIVRTFVRIGLGLAGGVALLIILASSFMLSTSQGDPKKVGDAKEMLTAAIIGILFVVFSIVVLQFIGVTILQIPGFGDS